MKLEKQVCSLALAKKLKKLGVKQKSINSWCDRGKYDCRGRGELFVQCSDCSYEYGNEAHYSAFTVAELGEMLKKSDPLFPHWLGGAWRNPANFNDLEVKAKTEANARAKMLIYLIENKLIKLK